MKESQGSRWGRKWGEMLTSISRRRLSFEYYNCHLGPCYCCSFCVPFPLWIDSITFSQRILSRRSAPSPRSFVLLQQKTVVVVARNIKVDGMRRRRTWRRRMMNFVTNRVPRISIFAMSFPGVFLPNRRKPTLRSFGGRQLSRYLAAALIYSVGGNSAENSLQLVKIRRKKRKNFRRPRSKDIDVCGGVKQPSGDKLVLRKSPQNLAYFIKEFSRENKRLPHKQHKNWNLSTKPSRVPFWRLLHTS